MSQQSERAQRVPNANNPRVLIRLVGLVASGVRRPTALAQVLDVELRTVHYYTQAGEWLGLLSTDGEVHLTALGVDLAFADPRQRLRRYAAAVWRTPFARDLLRNRSSMPDIETITKFILEVSDGELAENTARRRASAVRSLLEPAIGRKPGRRAARGEQLAFPFPPTPSPTRGGSEPRLPQQTVGSEYDPVMYSGVLQALLDEGELSTGHLRAVLDGLGGRDYPLGPYAQMAVERGDATRVADRLVLTQGGKQRREVAVSGKLVALSDPSYRAWLDIAETSVPTGLKARRERERLAQRHAAWDAFVFGCRLTPDVAKNAIGSILPGRDPRSLPLAGATGTPLAQTSTTFLEALDTPGLPVAFPSSLRGLVGGARATNALLQRAREAPAGVRLPCAADRRVVVHGGLLHPAEPLVRTVPDNVTLRVRLLATAPVVALTAATLLLSRRTGSRLHVVVKNSGPVVVYERNPLGPIIPILESFCEAQGWICARPSHGGLSGTELAHTLGELSIATQTGSQLVMNERLFVRLQEDAEARITYDLLRPLVDRIDAWLPSIAAGDSA